MDYSKYCAEALLTKCAIRRKSINFFVSLVSPWPIFFLLQPCTPFRQSLLLYYIVLYF